MHNRRHIYVERTGKGTQPTPHTYRADRKGYTTDATYKPAGQNPPTGCMEDGRDGGTHQATGAPKIVSTRKTSQLAGVLCCPALLSTNVNSRC